MNRLKTHQHLAYDANCLIYYCMHSEIQHGDKTISVVFPVLTDKVRKITELLTERNIKIKTIEQIYYEIAKSDRAGLVVEDLTNKEAVRSQLGLMKWQRFPSILKFRFIKSLDKKIRGLKGKTWFEIIAFTCSDSDLANIKNFYLSLSADPEKLKVIQRSGRMVYHPSNEDMHLINFSLVHSAPILSNDLDITFFKSELEDSKLCYKVYPLPEVVINEN